MSQILLDVVIFDIQSIGCVKCIQKRTECADEGQSQLEKMVRPVIHGNDDHIFAFPTLLLAFDVDFRGLQRSIEVPSINVCIKYSYNAFSLIIDKFALPLVHFDDCDGLVLLEMLELTDLLLDVKPKIKGFDLFVRDAPSFAVGQNHRQLVIVSQLGKFRIKNPDELKCVINTIYVNITQGGEARLTDAPQILKIICVVMGFSNIGPRALQDIFCKLLGECLRHFSLELRSCCFSFCWIYDHTFFINILLGLKGVIVVFYSYIFLIVVLVIVFYLNRSFLY